MVTLSKDKNIGYNQQQQTTKHTLLTKQQTFYLAIILKA